MSRVVITGLGIVSVLGSDLDTVSEALREGRSGLVVDQGRADLGFSSPLTGRLKGWRGERALSRKLRKSMAEAALYAAIAAEDALEDAALERSRLTEFDVGVIIGNDSTAGAAAALKQRVEAAGYTGGLGSGTIFQVMNSTVTMNLATMYGVRGANWTLSAACASGAHALGQAYALIHGGQQEIVIAGGAQELSWESMAAFDALKAFSKRVDDPATASRPFCQTRDGLVPSGGAAVLILESEAHAKARGARIYAEVLGYAFSSNGNHLSVPTADAPAYAIRRALEVAGLQPSDVDYVSAHATSTPVGDALEGQALLEVFGPEGPPVASTKALTGHECWMSGASEALYSLLMMRDGFMAPNYHLEALDEALEGLNVLTSRRDEAPQIVLSNAFGFGGTNSSLILRRWG